MLGVGRAPAKASMDETFDGRRERDDAEVHLLGRRRQACFEILAKCFDVDALAHEACANASVGHDGACDVLDVDDRLATEGRLTGSRFNEHVKP